MAFLRGNQHMLCPEQGIDNGAYPILKFPSALFNEPGGARVKLTLPTIHVCVLR